MLKNRILLTLLVFGLGKSIFAQPVLPGFRGWIYSSPPPNETLGTSSFLETNFNRAKLNWYIIDPLFYYSNTSTIFPESDLINHNTRQISPAEVLGDRSTIAGSNLLRTFDLRYNPDERGAYNFDVLPTNTSAGIDSNGRLLAPETRWAGIMRRFLEPDLPGQGIDSIEFWLMDPFLDNPTHDGLTLTFQMGEVSEDALIDGVWSCEPCLAEKAFIDTTFWGTYSISARGPQEFPDEDSIRSQLDVGLDGLPDEAERSWFKAEYLDRIANAWGVNSNAYLEAWEDPSGDNFHYFDGPSWDNFSLVERYDGINGMEGNSAIVKALYGSRVYTSYPDMEDLNLNRRLDHYESTEDYVLRIKPGMAEVASLIVDSMRSELRLVDGSRPTVTWYHFRFPLVKEGSTLSLDDFRNVPGLRLVISECQEPVTLRFVESQILNICESCSSDLDLGMPTAIPFPNPFDRELQFEFEYQDEKPSRLELWNMQGRKVEDYTDFEFDSSYFPGERLRPGIYVYRLTTTNDSEGWKIAYRGKVVKLR